MKHVNLMFTLLTKPDLCTDLSNLNLILFPLVLQYILEEKQKKKKNTQENIICIFIFTYIKYWFVNIIFFQSRESWSVIQFRGSCVGSMLCHLSNNFVHQQQ